MTKKEPKPTTIFLRADPARTALIDEMMERGGYDSRPQLFNALFDEALKREERLQSPGDVVQEAPSLTVRPSPLDMDMIQEMVRAVVGNKGLIAVKEHEKHRDLLGTAAEQMHEMIAMAGEEGVTDGPPVDEWKAIEICSRAMLAILKALEPKG